MILVTINGTYNLFKTELKYCLSYFYNTFKQFQSDP